jgi:hypothetical protein
MKKIAYCTFITVLLAFSISAAQFVDNATISSANTNYLGLKPADKPFSLIDLSRIKWFNSYSLSYFSGGGSSGSAGLYTTSLFYELSSSLSVGLKLGILHNPGYLFDRTASANASFLPGINLDFHPSQNFRISIGIDSYSGNYLNNSNSYDRFLWRNDQ